MYRELQPLRQALSAELKATLPPALPGVEAELLLQSYLDRLTLHVGCDVADQSLTLFAVDAAGEEVAHLLQVPNNPSVILMIRRLLMATRKMYGARYLTAVRPLPTA